MLKTPALILKKQNLSETDRILTIFSPILGKKRVVVRGVRRPLSKLAGHLDTMMLSQLILTEEEELPKVAGAVLAEPFENIRNSLPLLNQAYAITKIIERVTVEDVSERPIFQLTVDTLTRLNLGERWNTNWLFFLARLTNRLGVSISKFDCGICSKKIEGGGYWRIDEHKLSCLSCGETVNSLNLEYNSIKMLHLLADKDYFTIKRVSVPEAVSFQIEEIYLRLVTEWLNKPWHTYSAFGLLRGNIV
ncbi:MAG: DNA repair protein RecO [Candidatus Berkelbacteria bacterium]|nr:DNA repair protein RecO [Candidatus Berkelbacteria bacterium]MCR4308092.1 DNA repair protein RecO [Candidatus Berkelbacteria bacterium]